MNRTTGLFLIPLIGFTVAAQSISITGNVVNKNNQPVSKAVVSLAGQKLNDTTDSQGAFSFSKTNVAAITAPPSQGAEKMSLARDVVRLHLTKEARVTIEMFDMRGSLLAKTLDRIASAGDYRFDIAGEPLAANIKLVRVTIGQNVSTFRCFPIHKGNPATSFALPFSSTTSGLLAKTAVTVDTLKVTASGYTSNATPISSYQTAVTVTLDTSTLSKFSFFVTSLEGLQTLAKNTNGFGGDLRFGKTGQGAGLLGADSICRCLAENSMPGSKVKLWRAFLSVTKDASGNKVNAIDRIGTGPWYDRLGRLVSSTKSDLLNDRPNADAAIKNDLPNEFGVPNHRPDPNKANVDNHQFITGSGADGTLYSTTATPNSTCLDWTSTAASGSKPRAGLSWPQSVGGAGGKKNWISVFDLWGCEAGLDLTDNDKNGQEGVYTIGNGGGYGGFYCFALNP
jgi:hypothetical protein